MQGNIVRRFLPHSILLPRSISSFNQQCFIHHQKLYEKLNIPVKPKKPLSPYMRFLQEIRPTLQKEFPNKKQTELMKIAGQRWSVVDSSLKEKLVKQFTDETITYNKLLNEHKDKLTPEQKEVIRAAVMNQSELKEERQIKKKSKELGKPKRPLSTYLRYLVSKKSEKEKYPSTVDTECPGNKPSGSVAHGLSDNWDTMVSDKTSALEHFKINKPTNKDCGGNENLPKNTLTVCLSKNEVHYANTLESVSTDNVLLPNKEVEEKPSLTEHLKVEDTKVIEDKFDLGEVPHKNTENPNDDVLRNSFKGTHKELISFIRDRSGIMIAVLGVSFYLIMLAFQ